MALILQKKKKNQQETPTTINLNSYTGQKLLLKLHMIYT